MAQRHTQRAADYRIVQFRGQANDDAGASYPVPFVGTLFNGRSDRMRLLASRDGQLRLNSYESDVDCVSARSVLAVASGTDVWADNLAIADLGQADTSVWAPGRVDWQPAYFPRVTRGGASVRRVETSVAHWDNRPTVSSAPGQLAGYLTETGLVETSGPQTLSVQWTRNEFRYVTASVVLRTPLLDVAYRGSGERPLMERQESSLRIARDDEDFTLYSGSGLAVSDAEAAAGGFLSNVDATARVTDTTLPLLSAPMAPRTHALSIGTRSTAMESLPANGLVSVSPSLVRLGGGFRRTDQTFTIDFDDAAVARLVGGMQSDAYNPFADDVYTIRVSFLDADRREVAHVEQPIRVTLLPSELSFSRNYIRLWYRKYLPLVLDIDGTPYCKLRNTAEQCGVYGSNMVWSYTKSASQLKFYYSGQIHADLVISPLAAGSTRDLQVTFNDWSYMNSLAYGTYVWYLYVSADGGQRRILTVFVRVTNTLVVDYNWPWNAGYTQP